MKHEFTFLDGADLRQHLLTDHGMSPALVYSLRQGERVWDHRDRHIADGTYKEVTD
jgi:hypothetical protein